MPEEKTLKQIELPTLFVIFVCYAAFGVSTTILAEAVPLAGFVLLTLAITLHSSLQHEICMAISAATASLPCNGVSGGRSLYPL